jgi:hypothetical protein
VRGRAEAGIGHRVRRVRLMSYRVSAQYTADPASVFAVITDPDVVVARFEDAGDEQVTVERCEEEGAGFVVRWTRVATAPLPGFAKKVLSPRNTLVETDRWQAANADGSRSGTFEIETRGAPVKVVGTMRLEAIPSGGTRYTIEGDLQVRVPLVGGKIASWASGYAVPRTEAELAFVGRRLAAG